MAKSIVPVSSHDSRCSPSSCTTRSRTCGASAITRLSNGGNSLMTPASTTQNWNVRVDIRGSKPTCSPRNARIRSQQLADRLGQIERLRRRLHAVRDAHEQRVVEIAPQPRQRLAQRRLGDVEHLGGARQAALAQQYVQHPQMLQIQLRGITIGNVFYIHGLIV